MEDTKFGSAGAQPIGIEASLTPLKQAPSLCVTTANLVVLRQRMDTQKLKRTPKNGGQLDLAPLKGRRVADPPKSPLPRVTCRNWSFLVKWHERY